MRGECVLLQLHSITNTLITIPNDIPHLHVPIQLLVKLTNNIYMYMKLLGNLRGISSLWIQVCQLSA